MNTSLWLDRTTGSLDEPLPEDGSFEDLVVGAGLTGLTTAALLARAGRKVGVVEARHVGAVTTGNTTAKASVLQNTKLSGILRAQSRSRAAAYLEANQEGLAWLRRFCEDHGVPVQERDAITFAATRKDRKAVRGEYDAARSLGLDVRWADALDVPFPLHGAVVLPGQFQFDPMDVLRALVAEIRRHGGSVHEGHRVVSASKVGPPRVTLESGRTITADNVVLASGAPILDRALTFAKVEPHRSYLLAYAGVASPEGMFISAGPTTRSLRDVPSEDGSPVFLLGGSGHTAGRTRSETAHLDELRAWAGEYFPGATETHRWSAQDYGPYDGLPLFGTLPLGRGHIYYATGYDKWGMTNAVAASLYIAAELLDGQPPEWGRKLEHRLPHLRGALHVATMNSKVGAAMTRGWAGSETRSTPDDADEGTGAAGRSGMLPGGVSTIDGETCRLRTVCTHLGGALKWNDSEHSWDCPLHGSRFSPQGEVLQGPATRPLHRH